MTIDKLANMASLLSQSEHYRVIRQYQKPEFYHANYNSSKSIGVFLDIEATGLSYTNDKLIEIGMVKFEYTQDGRIFRLLDEFNAYQDPGKPISAFITQLTGITDDMVKGKQIDHEAVNTYLNDVDIIIAHNARFDRSFFESTFPNRPGTKDCTKMRSLKALNGEVFDILIVNFLRFGKRRI
jgi:DNA polymerase III subunit epsilon